MLLQIIALWEIHSRVVTCTWDGKNMYFSKKIFPKLDEVIFYENMNKWKWSGFVSRKHHLGCHGGQLEKNPKTTQQKLDRRKKSNRKLKAPNLYVICFPVLSSRRAVLSLDCKISGKEKKSLIFLKNPSLNVIKYHSLIHQIIHAEGCSGPAWF